MTMVFIGILVVLTLLLTKLWRDSKSEIAELQSKVASLKRQLARQGR